MPEEKMRELPPRYANLLRGDQLSAESITKFYENIIGRKVTDEEQASINARWLELEKKIKAKKRELEP